MTQGGLDVLVIDLANEWSPGKSDEPIRMGDSLQKFVPVAILVHEGMPLRGGHQQDREIPGWLVEELSSKVEVACMEEADPDVAY